ncbi:MAG: hypothetical protein D6675_01190 [Gemmatimonadetes bacterium]|nr:MAG: hypothetical protein D6675_01190 [Gemmatimonadota bacterium]
MKSLWRSPVFWGFILGGAGLGLESMLRLWTLHRLYASWGYPFDGALFGIGLGMSYGFAHQDREQLIYGGVTGAIAGAFLFLFQSILGAVVLGILMGISSCPKLKFDLTLIARIIGGIVGGLLAVLLVWHVFRYYAVPFNDLLPISLQHSALYGLVWGSLTGAFMGIFVNNSIELFALPNTT